MSKIPEKDDDTDTAGRVFGGARAGEYMQTRFTRIPNAHLNKETVAGIRDMNLGRMKNGKPTGAPTIRFDTGHNSGANPHINIDPKGHPKSTNPHIEVPAEVIQYAKVINKTIKYAGITLTVAAVAIDTWRIGSAVKDDLYVREHADEIIEELESSIRKLRKSLETETKSTKRSEIRTTIEHLENVLRDVKRTKIVLVKTIKTVSSVGGSWGGGAAGGAAGAWGGAKAGALVGSAFGPVGTVVGAPVGAIIGAIGGGVLAGIGGSAVGEMIADEALKLADD
ncbi:uncharacterized protein LOC128678717 [Plodia interpunctella]|uniref:uncharacterized protein LOC128678717 n=1 Tax=Plodia interpunctella TaxID=58824 RepID=UPI0023680E61|nr:uncharacterized protein LOC128678717 [Plodia interpunctella]